MKKVKILAVAPYEGLKELITTVAEDYNEINVDVVIGDLHEGVKEVDKRISNGYDIIISRGGTAELLSKKFAIPVINIEVSGYDFLRVIRLSQFYSGKTAIVGFPQITYGASVICDLIQSNMEIFTIHKAGEVEEILQRLQKEHFSVIIGDNVTITAAKNIGLNGILITSNRESIQKALEEAIKTFGYIEKIKQSQLFFEALVHKSTENIIVYSEDGRIAFANLPDSLVKKLNSRLRDNIGAIFQGKTVQNIFIDDDSFFSYKSSTLKLNDIDTNYALFKIRKVPTKGIKVYSLTNVSGSIHAMHTAFRSNNYAAVKETVDKAEEISKNDEPVFIYGEPGSGRTILAYAIYMNSNRSKNPFIVIDCELLDNDTMHFLFEELTGTFLQDTLCTIYLKSVQCLNSGAQKGLLRYLENDNCRIIASSDRNMDLLVSGGHFNKQLYEKLNVQNLSVLSLSERKDDIQDISTLFIGEANARFGKQVIALDQAALYFLKEYDWKYNISQLKDIIYAAVADSDSSFISEEEIIKTAKRLEKETNMTGEIRLSPDKTLDELEKDIIRFILREEKYNQSKASKRLGISRSTMWRKLK